MKLSTYALSIFAAAGLVSAAPTQPVISVTYESGSVKTYNYEQCIPVQTGDDLLKSVFVLQSATCYPQEDPQCQRDATPPFGITVPKGLYVPNALDFAQLVAQGARCYPNALPGIPIQPF